MELEEEAGDRSDGVGVGEDIQHDQRPYMRKATVAVMVRFSTNGHLALLLRS